MVVVVAWQPNSNSSSVKAKIKSDQVEKAAKEFSITEQKKLKLLLTSARRNQVRKVSKGAR